MHLENFGGWLNYPCYYFFWAYKEGHLFNSSNYANAEVEVLVEGPQPLRSRRVKHTRQKVKIRILRVL